MSSLLRYSYVCAVDFGTAGTGFAWAPLTSGTLKSFDSVNVGEWPGDRGSNKTRTSVVLNTGTNDVVFFGSQAVLTPLRKGKHRLFDLFKMALYDRKPGDPLVFYDTEQQPLDGFLVVRACLLKIVETFFENMQDKGQGSSTLTSKDVLWVLTVPAIWDAAAKDMMKRAAAAAFNVDDPDTQIVIALEPESAALWCLSNGDVKPSAGEVYMMVDCGGGTLDVTINEVVNVKSFPPVVKEVHAATGGDFGSTRIDFGVLEVLKAVFGEHRFKQLERDGSNFMKFKLQIETAKCAFADDSDVCLVLPESLKNMTEFDTMTDQACVEAYNESHGTSFTLSGRYFTFPQEEFKKFLDPHIRSITAHINRLLKKCERVKYIIVVGNFAMCKLLRDAIKTAFHGDNDRVVIVPRQPGNTIMQGAVIYGVHRETAVIERVVQRTYGVGISRPFEDGIHPPEQMFIYEGKQYCGNCFDVFVTKGQRVPNDYQVSRNYVRLRQSQTSITTDVYECDSERPPKYVTDRACKKIATNKIMLSGDGSITSTMLFGGTIIIHTNVNAAGEKQAVNISFQ